ncbi:hypothetical protein QJS10_CPB12g00146 [Acorus calamus]|uniref:Uncharacterized protein n=1 Tax=Acorus calamus TaxID=4465 RepID=A0AAV9DS25_ACOCL|nr:hypothetical protein QJS10_CPB12g00146 [Acorus calamus]
MRDHNSERTFKSRRVLSTIHADIEVLFSDLSVSNIESILVSYLNESVKLIDIYNRHRLLIRLVIHLLSSSSGAGEVKLRRAMLETERSEREKSQMKNTYKAKAIQQSALTPAPQTGSLGDSLLMEPTL